MTYKALIEAFADCKDAERAAWVLDEMRDMQVTRKYPLLLLFHSTRLAATKMLTGLEFGVVPPGSRVSSSTPNVKKKECVLNERFEKVVPF